MVGSRPPRVLFPSLPRLFRRGGRRPLSPRLARSFVENSTLSFFSAPSTNGLQRTLINSLVLAERSRLPVHRSRGHASREEIGVDNFNSREVKKEEEGEIILDDAALPNEPVKIIYRSFPLNSHCIVSFLPLAFYSFPILHYVGYRTRKKKSIRKPSISSVIVPNTGVNSILTDGGRGACITRVPSRFSDSIKSARAPPPFRK